jgi:hypothetical protein
MPLCPLCWTLKLNSEMRVVKVKTGAIEACVECVGPITKSLERKTTDRAEENKP